MTGADTLFGEDGADSCRAATGRHHQGQGERHEPWRDTIACGSGSDFVEADLQTDLGQTVSSAMSPP